MSAKVDKKPVALSKDCDWRVSLSSFEVADILGISVEEYNAKVEDMFLNGLLNDRQFDKKIFRAVVYGSNVWNSQTPVIWLGLRALQMMYNSITMDQVDAIKDAYYRKRDKLKNHPKTQLELVGEIRYALKSYEPSLQRETLVTELITQLSDCPNDTKYDRQEFTANPDDFVGKPVPNCLLFRATSDEIDLREQIIASQKGSHVWEKTFSNVDKMMQETSSFDNEFEDTPISNKPNDEPSANLKLPPMTPTEIVELLDLRKIVIAKNGSVKNALLYYVDFDDTEDA